MNFAAVACCGVREISLLSSYTDPKVAMRMFGQGLFSKRPGEQKTSPMFRYVVFTQAQAQNTRLTETGYGYRFAAYIREHNLGTLIDTPFNVNPNSNNNLKMWVWTVDLEVTKRHWEELDKEHQTERQAALAKPVMGATNPSFTLTYDQIVRMMERGL
jgi:hypothetical protein